MKKYVPLEGICNEAIFKDFHKSQILKRFLMSISNAKVLQLALYIPVNFD